MARDFESKNIIVGAATFYVGPQGSEMNKVKLTSPTATAQDPTKIDPGAAASWYHMGYTQNGVTMNIEPTYGEVMVDQLLDVARLFKSAQRVMVATSLTETTLENLYVAIGSKASDLRADAGASADIWTADGGSGGPTTSSSLYDVSSSAAGSVKAALDINGGALGYTPIERSVLFVGPGPAKLATATSGANSTVERLYFGYRAVSMDAVGVAVQRDNATLFPVNFRLLPSQTNEAADGNASYGKIVDRVY